MVSWLAVDAEGIIYEIQRGDSEQMPSGEPLTTLDNQVLWFKAKWHGQVRILVFRAQRKRQGLIKLELIACS